MQAQMPIEAKCRRATVVVDNGGTREATAAAVRQLVQRWRPGRVRTLVWWILLAPPAALALVMLRLWAAVETWWMRW
jgi:hypothetical protein